LSDPKSDEQREVRDTVKELLSFYGLELQSHSSVILGFGLITFAIVQAWGSTADTKRFGVAFAVIVGIVATGMAHQIWRLYSYGKMSSALFYGSDTVYDRAKKEWGDREIKENPTMWSQLFDLAKVSVYAEWMLKERSRHFVHLGLLRISGDSHSVRLRFRVLLGSFLVGFWVSYVLFFGGLLTWLSVGYVTLLGGVISIGFLLRRRIVKLLVRIERRVSGTTRWMSKVTTAIVGKA